MQKEKKSEIINKSVENKYKVIDWIKRKEEKEN